MTQKTQPKLTFDHPPLNFSEKKWVQVRRPGFPLYKDPQFKVWAFRRGEEFHSGYYPTKHEYEAWFLSFHRGMYHGKYNVRAFGYGLLDYFLNKSHFSSYIQRKVELKNEIDELWRAHDITTIRSLSFQRQLCIIDIGLHYMMRAFGIDVLAPMIGEIAPEYATWWLGQHGVPEERQNRLLQNLLASGFTSETIMRQLEIRRQIDDTDSPEQFEAVTVDLLKRYAHSRTEIGGYAPFTRSDLMEEYHSTANISLQLNDFQHIRNTALAEVGANSQEEWIFYLFSYCQYSRDERKEYVQKLITLIDWCLEGLSDKFGISVVYLRNALCGELIEDNLRNPAYAQLLYDRHHHGLVMGFSDGEDGRYLMGSEGWNLFSAINESSDFDISSRASVEMKGQSAYHGNVVGRVRVVVDPKESVHEADFILVTGMTSPNFIHLMHRCAAIVTDEGGITCHAAILSRELRKPCIVGLGDASRVLKDGDLVEVDANRGVVRRLL